MRTASAFLLTLQLALSAAGCNQDTAPTGCAVDSDCAATPDTPRCDVAAGACVPPTTLLGPGDGTPASVDLTVILQPDRGRDSTGLAFNSARPNELWVVNRSDDSVYIVENVTVTPSPWVRRRDPDASHFMDSPSGIAFGPGGNWARLEEVVPPGTLEQPSGLVLDQGVLYVTDAVTGRIHAFATDGRALHTLDTGLGAGALAGLAVGPDHKLYFVDRKTSRVYRVDP